MTLLMPLSSQMSFMAIIEFFPSKTIPLAFSSTMILWPYSIPRVWFLLSRDVEVRTKSPNPQYSPTVDSFPPTLMRISFVSSNPFVNTPYRAFSLMSIPSHIPLAIALTFFNTPHISSPMTSSMIFTLNCWVDNTDFTFSAFSRFLDAMFETVGRFSIISDAKLGPDNATKLSSKYSSITFPIVFREGYSIPLAVVTRIVSSSTISFRDFRAFLKADDGIAKKIMLQSLRSVKSVVAIILSFSCVLG